MGASHTSVDWLRPWRARILICLQSLILTGCVVTAPASESGDSILLTLTPDNIDIQGGSQASTEQFQILFFVLGQRASFVEAEDKAVKAKHADLLMARTRLRSFEGFVIPVSWLNAFGIPADTDVPVVGWEVFTVAGTAVRVPAWHQSKSLRGPPVP